MAAVQAELEPWFVPAFIAGAVMFVIGVVGFAVGIFRSGLLGSGLGALAVAALALMALSRLIPLAAFQLYVQSLAALVAMWPLAYRIWRSNVTGATL